ncbi:hypothetical protein BpHYR1_035280 [Brachionus plicatilis]|uniref:Uncharacterized protein n=1 Tax=Brachionus plicatilis TaxID=10195 RepID=A0A3M7PX02_BRAPC|nr:hypothetical protein BpHYR1_035280 [Brachionus plicatilis]
MHDEQANTSRCLKAKTCLKLDNCVMLQIRSAFQQSFSVSNMNVNYFVINRILIQAPHAFSEKIKH